MPDAAQTSDNDPIVRIRAELERRGDGDRQQIVRAMRHLTGMPTLDQQSIDRLTPGAAIRLGEYLSGLPDDERVDYEAAIGSPSTAPMPPSPDQVSTTGEALAHAESALDQKPPRKLEACAFLDRALDLDRAGQDHLGAIGMTRASGLYRQSGRSETALRCAEGVVQAESRVGDERHARTSAAGAAMDLGNPDMAEAFLRPVVERWPDDLFARKALSRLRAMQGRTAEAIALRATCVHDGPEGAARAKAALDRELRLTQDHFARHGDDDQARRIATLRGALFD